MCRLVLPIVITMPISDHHRRPIVRCRALRVRGISSSSFSGRWMELNMMGQNDALWVYLVSLGIPDTKIAAPGPASRGLICQTGLCLLFLPNLRMRCTTRSGMVNWAEDAGSARLEGGDGRSCGFRPPKLLTSPQSRGDVDLPSSSSHVESSDESRHCARDRIATAARTGTHHGRLSPFLEPLPLRAVPPLPLGLTSRQIRVRLDRYRDIAIGSVSPPLPHIWDHCVGLFK